MQRTRGFSDYKESKLINTKTITNFSGESKMGTDFYQLHKFSTEHAPDLYEIYKSESTGESIYTYLSRWDIQFNKLVSGLVSLSYSIEYAELLAKDTFERAILRIKERIEQERMTISTNEWRLILQKQGAN